MSPWPEQVRLGGWSLLESSPGAFGDPAQLPSSGWIEAGDARPAAAVLRDAGRWSLQGLPKRFDASDWWYRTTFDAPATAAEHVALGFDGLATHAALWLNGRRLGSSSSMFVSLEFEVREWLRPRGNQLHIRFEALDARLEERRPRPRWRTPMVENQQLRWHRTSLLGRTPGWTPPAAVVGPWRPVWMRAGRPLLNDVRIDVRVDPGTGDGWLDFSAGVPEDRLPGLGEPTLELWRGDTLAASQACATARAGLSARLHVAEPRLWWPHTHGEPHLYELRLRLPRPQQPTQSHSLGHLGFRTIEWDRGPGRFALKVNGVDVFCRGACWTPIDPVMPLAAPAAYGEAVSQAARAGMNMLRVGGPFVYEDEAFFEACDRQGMMVWSDFMFANMDYPEADPAFMELVDTEVRQQLARWQGRPCIAMLCGSSESEQQAAMWGAPREAWSAPLFESRLPALVEKHLPSAEWWPSSAHGGAFPHQVDEGTTSYYGVGAYLRPPEDARHSGLKFATECLAFSNVPDAVAIDAMPGGRSLRVTHAEWKAAAPRDLGAGWDFEDVRDHYLALLYGVDPFKLRSQDHERYLQLSRAVSGEVMARALNEWRRAASGCGGALVWFLRDLRPGAGWGLLDSSGRPKACWHAVSRALQPLTAWLTDEGNNGLVAHIVNERPKSFAGALEAKVWRGQDVLAGGTMAIEMAPRSARAFPLAALLDRFMDLTHAFRFGPPGHDATSLTLRAGDGTMLAQAVHHPMPGIERHADLGLVATSREGSDGSLLVTVSSRKLARGVHFDVPGFVAEDAWFDLLPGQAREIVLRRDSTTTPKPRRFVDSLSSTAAQLIQAGSSTAPEAAP